MKVFNIIAGIASILSLTLSVIAIRKVCKIETRIKIEDNSGDVTNSVVKVSQKANGKNIMQAGGDLNV